jgi:hypothetical protein
MGDVFIPKPWRASYDNPWRIACSNRSTSQTELTATHINAMSPAQQNIVLTYIQKNGYSMGESEYVKVNKDHTLTSNERWNEEERASDQKREIERVLVPGISNDSTARDELNILFFLSLEKHIPKWPWAFAMSQHKKGFGI